MLWKSETIRKSNLEARRSTQNSWEEEAFAEDAAQPFGAFVWPPRSYLCSFCKREFRSAQALGGHMNVHRRERAKLKQCPSPTPSSGHHREDYLGYQNQTCFLVTHVNPITTRATVSSNQDIDIIPSSSWCINPVQHEVDLNSERKEDQLEVLKEKRSRIQQDEFELPDLCQEIVSRKRQKIDESSAEYVDLELRLGDQPSLKQIQ